ncbi:helix-turn-helix transcriptional regulator [Paraburkholderia sp. MMS20-SJTN17]|uniref:Helix-turn-helix transcriptional regulator n=1 Tax=Paraburkholderia translucens TaxID=2886945 RepID=A0ABS8KCF8_9BURK|nr:winged helix-turn-helix domain-containing protein [Paraburkholderia sp. MMS20-SJTN17]MCC8402444.1 helix-turn-helix transcriptional regulator [Paraburkholderia sp. MMS20-SJTN17]
MTQTIFRHSTCPSGKRVIRIGECEVDLSVRVLRRRGEKLELGSRAFDILAVLALAAGRVVTKNELMDAVWPDTVVEENNLHVHLSSIRKALGRDGKFIVTVPRRGYQLIAPRIDAPGSDQIAQDRPFRVNPRVAPREDRLIGRESAMAEIRSLLPTTRVLTLTGAGGIGKTSIARELARSMSAQYEPAVHFVELATHNTCRGVAQALAASYGIPLGSEESDLERVALMLAGTKGLLIVDNAEHVVEYVAQFLEFACHYTSELRFLVTSRLRLRVPCEVVYRVGPLALPEVEDAPVATLRSPSSRLFQQRLFSNGQNMNTSGDRRRLIDDICRHLDGVPLAIELAAGRASILGLEALRLVLKEPLLYLSGGFRTAQERHKSLRASLDWSFEMLSGRERAVFRRLCVFSYPFDAEAACLIARDDTLNDSAVMDCVCELVDKSMVEIRFEGAAITYHVLALARAYGREKLAEAGELDAIMERHALYAGGQSTDEDFAQISRQAPHTAVRRETLRDSWQVGSQRWI